MKKILNLILVLFSVVFITSATDFPIKPITIYIPFPTGGTAEQLTRLFADQMAQDMKQPVLIQTNDKGISATDYINQVKTLPNDGYHLIIGNLGTHTSSVMTDRKSILYDPIDDFEPVAILGKTPMYMVLRPDFPANNFKEFVDYIRNNPDKKFTIAHAGVGTTAYLAATYFDATLKLNLTFIPYKGPANALKDVANGYADMMIDQTTSALPFIKGGLLKGLFITSENPSSLTPDIPTSKQIGLPEFDIKGWHMVFAPKGTPKYIVNILNNAIVKALQDKFVASEYKLSNTIIINEDMNNYNILKDFLRNQTNYWQEISTIIDTNKI